MPAPTISDSESTDFVSPGTTVSAGSLTVGAGTVLIVAVVGSSSADPVQTGPTLGCHIGGVRMLPAFEAQGGGVWYLEDPLGNGLTGSEALLIDFNAGGFRAASTFYAVDHSGALALIDTTDGSGYADNAPTLYTLPNMSGSITDAISFGFAYNNGFFTGDIVLGGDLSQDHSHNIASERIKTFHDTTTPLGGHAYANGTGGTMFMGMAMFGPAPDPDVTFSPDAIGVEVGFTAGLVFGPGVDVTLFPEAFGVEVGFYAGLVFGAASPRQVMLVGSGLETPEMTEGGDEGDVLTFHPGSKPTWEASGGGGPHALDDHTDVDVPTPSDGDVLTFDSGTGDWVAEAPTGGAIDWAEDGDITTAAFGDAAAANAGTEAAPAGHRHGMPANPVSGAAVMAVLDFGETGDIVASAPGDTGAAGATGEVADAGHRHPRESYATLTAGLDFGESGDISASAPADTAAAGATGEVADAGHRHPRLAEPVVINIVLDGGGVVLTTGVKGDIYFPHALTITEWTILGDPTGAIVIDLWVDTYANYPPVVGDSITASAKPTVTATNPKGQSSSIGTWTNAGAIAAGRTMRVNVDSVTSMTKATLALTCVRA